jgi:AcrR family transcriptional regulator
LAATRRLLADRRLESLRVVDLIEAAGVSRASFYLYFESKFAAVAAAAEDAMERIHQVWHPWLVGADLDLEQVWLQSIAVWREQQAVLMAAAEAWRAEASVADEWALLMRAYSGATQAYIERSRAAGQAPSEPDAATLATVLVWLNESAMYMAFSRPGGPRIDDRRLAQTLSAVWRRVIHESASGDAAPLTPQQIPPEPRPIRPPLVQRCRVANPDVRNAFIRATERLLQERRLEELTVVDVIEAAGFSRPTFYEYFQSKHAVVAALAEEVIDEIYERLWRPWLEVEEPATRAALIAHYLDTLAAWRRHRAVLVAAAAGWRTDPAAYATWGERWERYVAITQRHIELARAAGSAPHDPDSETLANVLVWLSEAVLYLTFAEPPLELGDDGALAATMSAVWMRSIYGAAEPLT